MKKPIIFSIDDDPQVLQAIQRDLRKEYRKGYRILSTSSANEALDSLKDLKLKGEDVALFLSDQRMPEMLGVEFLERARESYPEAKRVLLTAYSDIEAAIKAINSVQLDYYLMKPWDPPEEKLYSVLNDLLDDWQAGHHKIKDFLSANMIPYQWLDAFGSDKAKELLDMKELELSSLPAVFFDDGSFISNPSLSDLAEKTGLKTTVDDSLFDVAIIGAGPAGLAAGVYGGSEGLKTVLIEKRAPGGQAGTSSRIENYLGFPKGLSGADLARRAITQATRFGIEFISPQEVTGIEIKDNYKILRLADGNEVNTKSVVLTSGVDYRKHEAEGIEKLTGAGIYYGAANTEAHACKDKNAFVIGGGNSAGQAAVYLSRYAANVFIVVRRPDLSSSMSQYLIDQIEDIDNIHLLSKTTVVSTQGDEQLETVTLENVDSGDRKEEPASALFIFIGAKPYTEWIPDFILKNDKGFIETGAGLLSQGMKGKWKLERDPYMLETSIPGVFAAGDVRAGAMNRVASAVGEGAMAIKLVHEYLAES
jgi:thioredoxin reductase (NADPH)